ncbi:MAG: DUF1896 family protein [Ginsengibacter sp.]
MQEALISKLHEYIRQNNPDVLLQLEEAGTVTGYLSNKVSTVNASLNQLEIVQPAYIIDEACLNLLTQDLRPSKYNYITTILEEEFTDRYQHLQETGILKFEVINLITKCQSTFADLNFSEANEDNRFLRYAITGIISEYFESNK